MKHKKFLFFIGLCTLIYGIYFFNHDDRINYIAIGDSLSAGVNAYGEISYGYSDFLASYLDRKDKLKSYSKGFATSGYRVSDVLHQLETNQILTVDHKTLSLKKSLRDAQLVTLSIGGNDLLSNVSLSTVDLEVLDETQVIKIIDKMNMELATLLKELRKYAKQEIILIGYYNPFKNTSLNMNRVFTYLDEKTKLICQKYDVTYVNTYTLFKDNPNYLPNPTNIHPSSEGYEAISKKIIDLIEK